MQAHHCPACGVIAPLVHVHSHAQCSRCGTVIESCCMGAGDEDSEGTAKPTELHRVHLRAVFAPGGKPVTVTAAAAAHRLHELLGCDLTAAQGALEGAVEAGELVRTGQGHLRLRKG